MSETLDLQVPLTCHEVESAVPGRSATVPVGRAAPEVQPLAIPTPSQVTLGASVPLTINPALFDSVNVQAQVMLGHVELNFGRLMRLAEGDLLKSNRLVHQPVDVLVNGNLVARGELVAVGDNFGVRVTQIPTDGAA
jgi:flagellar motor switch protein FliN/FliY